jgi:hypothetical protein
MEYCELCKAEKTQQELTPEQKKAFKTLGLTYLSTYTYSCECPAKYLDEIVILRDLKRELDPAELNGLKSLKIKINRMLEIRNNYRRKLSFIRLGTKEHDNLEKELKNADYNYNQVLEDRAKLFRQAKPIGAAV